jgi:putative flavoprotein involved in K+ transport
MPGYTYTGADPDGLAHYSGILRIIEAYAVSSRAPMREHTEVVSLGEDGHGTGSVVSLADGSPHARRVVVATGPFQRALIPQPSQHVSPSVLQTDPTRAIDAPATCRTGRCSWWAAARPGCQIADELLHAGRTVYLSVSRHRRAPRRLRGRDVYWWLDEMGRFA